MANKFALKKGAKGLVIDQPLLILSGNKVRYEA